MSVQRVAVLLHEPVGTISPYLHGEFADTWGSASTPASGWGNTRPSPTSAASGGMW